MGDLTQHFSLQDRIEELEEEVNTELNKVLEQELGFDLSIKTVMDIILGNVESRGNNSKPQTGNDRPPWYRQESGVSFVNIGEALRNKWAIKNWGEEYKNYDEV